MHVLFGSKLRSCFLWCLYLSQERDWGILISLNFLEKRGVAFGEVFLLISEGGVKECNNHATCQKQQINQEMWKGKQFYICYKL